MAPNLFRSGAITALLASAAPLALAQELDPAEVNLRVCNCSDVLLSSRLSKGFPREEIDKARGAVKTVTSDDVAQAMSGYKATKAKVDQDISGLKAEGWRIRFSSAAIDPDLFSAAKNVATLGFESEVEEAIEAQNGKIEQARSELATGIVARLLQQNSEALDALNAGDRQTAHALLFGQGTASYLLASAGLDASLDPQAKTELLAALGRMTVDNLGHLAGQVDEVAARQTELLEQYVELKDEVSRFAAGVQQEMQNIHASFNGLNAAYGAIAELSTDNAYRLDRIERVMFGQMSATERFEALEKGEFKSILQSMPPDKRETFHEGLEKAKNVESWKSTGDSVIAGASGILNIARNAGMDVGDAQEAVNKAQMLLTGALSIYAGGPMGIIGGLSTISNVFGGGGPNPNAEVLAEIKRLSAQMKQYHEVQMQRFADLESKIEAGFADVKFRQSETLRLLEQVAQGINELIDQGASACRRLTNIEKDGTLLQLPPSLFPMGDFGTCREHLRNLFGVKTGTGQYSVSTLFRDASTTLSTEAAKHAPAYLAWEQIILPMRAYSLAVLARRFPDCSDANRAHLLMVALTEDPRHEGSTRQRIVPKDACATVTPLKISNDDLDMFLLSQFEKPLVFEGMARMLWMASEVFPLDERMVNPGDKPLKLIDFNQQTHLVFGGLNEAAKHRIRHVIHELTEAYATGLLAIAQINLLSGDLVMEELEEDLLAGLAAGREAMNTGERIVEIWKNCTGDASVPERYYSAICVLSRNEILRENFARYLIRKYLENGRITATGRYQIAMERYLSGTGALWEIQATFSKELPLVDGDVEGKEPLLSFPLFAQQPYKNPDTSGATSNFKDSFSLAGDLRIALPPWHEVASDRQMLGIPGALSVVQATERISELIRAYRVSIELPLEARGVAHESAVAVAIATP